MTTARDDARRAAELIGCLDLTNLNEDCTEADIDALCARAATPSGPVAAICIWPRFVRHAAERLAGGAIRIATVVNFPHGGDDVERACAETREAVAGGADEIDLVIAYRRLPDVDFVEQQVRRVKQAAGAARLKTILETGEIGDPDLIRRACVAALAGGADFLKTSTGKTSVSATLDAARILLTAIAEHGGSVGFKPAGGIKTFEDARSYRDLAESICGPDWPTPDRFRIGASGVLTDLLAVAAGKPREQAKGAY